MKGDVIPDENHVARYCPRIHISSEGDILASAFYLKEDENTLSVNWLECLGAPNREQEIQRLRETIALTLRKSAKFAVVNIGNLRKSILEESPDKRNLLLLHEPTEKDPSHSEISNMNPQYELIAELIIEKVKMEVYPARA